MPKKMANAKPNAHAKQGRKRQFDGKKQGDERSPKKSRGIQGKNAGGEGKLGVRESMNPFFAQPKDFESKPKTSLSEGKPGSGVVLEDKNVVKFFSSSKDKDAALLSNFAPMAVVLDGTKYKTGEHAFHACKFQCAMDMEGVSPERKQHLLDHKDRVIQASNSLGAKKLGGRAQCELTEAELKVWANVAESIQTKICEYKLGRYNLVRQFLLESEDKYLLHQENRGRQPIWGGRINQQTKELIGDNKLGKIWMVLRDILDENKKGKAEEGDDFFDEEEGTL
jgi:ribA/ribD-fused uncharacterized protein